MYQWHKQNCFQKISAILKTHSNQRQILLWTAADHCIYMIWIFYLCGNVGQLLILLADSVQFEWALYRLYFLHFIAICRQSVHKSVRNALLLDFNVLRPVTIFFVATDTRTFYGKVQNTYFTKIKVFFRKGLASIFFTLLIYLISGQRFSITTHLNLSHTKYNINLLITSLIFQQHLTNDTISSCSSLATSKCWVTLVTVSNSIILRDHRCKNECLTTSYQ